MFTLWRTIQKDVLLLLRDKVGLLLMFIMPITLVLVITSVQNSTFELVNNNKISLLIANSDTGSAGKQLVHAIHQLGMFKITEIRPEKDVRTLASVMHDRDALVAISIPDGFTLTTAAKAKEIAGNALQGLGVDGGKKTPAAHVDTISFFYSPVMQPPFRASVEGALRTAIQNIQSKQILENLYSALDSKSTPDSLEMQMAQNQVPLLEVAVARNGGHSIPTASQHNVPAWTIFAMFFVVISLGSSVVREKLNGSFLRLKTLPTSFFIALLSKQITYVAVTLIQAVVIFSIGIFIFPHIGLPALNLPNDLLALAVVTLLCGWCASSFAVFIGVFAETQEQANGLGAASIVMLAAIGGLLVPSFAMPVSFLSIMKISPLHWCLEAYYALFLEGARLRDIAMNIIPLLVITALLQLLIFVGLKQKNLI